MIFAPNLATPGAIDLELPDGPRLIGHLLGLAYAEGTNSVLVAEVKDCAGERGMRIPSFETVLRIAEGIRVDLGKLINKASRQVSKRNPPGHKKTTA